MNSQSDNATTTTIDPESEVLEGELADLQAGIAATERRIADLAELLTVAQAAEGEALAAVDASKTITGPLVAATRDAGNQLGLFIGDAYWRAQHPQAADAFAHTQAAQEVLLKASAETIRVSKERTRLVWDVLPALHGARDDKQKELEQHQRTQAQAVEKAKGWRDRLRGKP